MQEVWKNIEGYEERYQVSNLGRIKILKDRKGNGIEEIKDLTKSKSGYVGIKLSLKGKSKITYVHRLVAENFLPNPNNYPVVNHKDENPSNNRLDNLEWCTYQYNSNYGTRIERIVKKNRSRKQRKISRRGSSLTVLIPQDIVEELNLKEGEVMDMQKKGKSIVINKIDKGDKK